MTCTYLKTETDRLRHEKLPVRVIYRDGDTVHVAWAKPPSADQEAYVAAQFTGHSIESSTDLPL
jgi:hypothetical protein